MIETLEIATRGKGLYDFGARLHDCLARSGLRRGLCTLFVQHTSASLLVQENADPAVRRDLETWLARLVPEDDALYTHRSEGPDDMPAHLRAALTQTSLTIPVLDGRLALGTWQGVYLWEHRRAPQHRRVLVALQPL